MYKKLLIVFSIVLFFTCGCNKQQGSGTYTFVNQTDRLVKIFIFRTEADYIEGAYPVVSGSISPNSNYTIPIDVISNNRNYYVEWYSDNFDYNNWGDTTAQVKFTPGDRTNFYITTAEKNNIRKLCLSGNNPWTTWIAVDAVSDTDIHTSIWPLLPDTEQMLKVIMTRRYNAIYDQYLHHPTNDTIPYGVYEDATGIHVSFGGFAASTLLSTSAPSSVVPNSIDTAWISTNGRRYLMVKQ